jgi:TolB-like protein/tetratricopeptide (TPR) repeat protein
VTEPSHAVFLSYASQDSQAAQRIAEVLRAAGIEVWFDQSELRGGDAWDLSIRKQIRTCALFIPVISKHTHDRDEGYFRLEWKLAVDRSHLISPHRAFLLPVVIDDTRDDDENVPDRFRDVQWTRLPAGETPLAFVERVQRLVSPETSTPIRQPVSAQSAGAGILPASVHASSPPKRGLLIAVAVLILGALGYFAVEKLWVPRTAMPSSTVTGSAAPATFAPPPHSIAVLPFVNMSGDKEQEYFSDGLTEEVLNSLAEINELQVAARTSAFSFKGTNTDISTIARKLNVGAVLEGSVRRSGNTVRVTTQLINAITGFHLWSHTYDRTLDDVLKLETEIATAVASALKVTLLGNVGARTELGGTRNPAAFDAYLRGMASFRNYRNDQDLLAAIAAYSEAIKADPEFALAYAERAQATRQHLDEFGTPKGAEAVQADARRAIALAPDLAEGHLALAEYLDTFQQDLTLASAEYERALALAPGNEQVIRPYAVALAQIGRTDESVAAARRAVALDPLSTLARTSLGRVLWFAHRREETIAAMNEASRLDANDPWAAGLRGLSYHLLGDEERARASCEIPSEHYEVGVCRAVVYQRLGRTADARKQLEDLHARWGDGLAYQLAQIYSQWGDKDKAMQWLETAARLRDTGLKQIRRDPLVESLRGEPRFQAIERALNFPP